MKTHRTNTAMYSEFRLNVSIGMEEPQYHLASVDGLFQEGFRVESELMVPGHIRVSRKVASLALGSLQGFVAVFKLSVY